MHGPTNVKNEQKCSVTNSYPWHYTEVSGIIYTPADLPQERTSVSLE